MEKYIFNQDYTASYTIPPSTVILTKSFKNGDIIFNGFLRSDAAGQVVTTSEFSTASANIEFVIPKSVLDDYIAPINTGATGSAGATGAGATGAGATGSAGSAGETGATGGDGSNTNKKYFTTKNIIIGIIIIAVIIGILKWAKVF